MSRSTITIERFHTLCCTLQPSATRIGTVECIQGIHATDLMPLDISREKPYRFSRVFSPSPSVSEKLAVSPATLVRRMGIVNIAGFNNVCTMPLLIEDIELNEEPFDASAKMLVVFIRDLVFANSMASKPGGVTTLFGTQPDHSGNGPIDSIVILQFGTSILVRLVKGGVTYSLRLSHEGEIVFESVNQERPTW